MAEAIKVQFPLRGEWVAATTPAHRIPSHGTDQFGQRYAYDFTRLGWGSGKPNHPFRKSVMAYMAGRVRLEDCYAWAAPIHSPFDGKVIKAADGWPERERVSLINDLLAVRKNGRDFRSGKADFRAVAGNYLIIEGAECFAFIAHAKTGSIQHLEGAEVKAGELLALVGHSGNSTVPHLHFHLMDSPDILSANGLPCAFHGYDAFEGGEWTCVANGVPELNQRIRFEGEPNMETTELPTAPLQERGDWDASFPTR